MLTQRIAWEPMRSRDSATFTGSYQTLGIPLSYPSYICKMVNNSTSDVTISTDGVNDMDFLPRGGFWLYDECKSKIPDVQFIPAGTQLYVKGSAGTGLVYLVSQYIVSK